MTHRAVTSIMPAQPLAAELRFAPSGGPEGNEDFISVGRVFAIIRRQKLAVILVAGVILLAAVGWIVTLKPYYESATEVMVGARQMISATPQNPYADQAVDLVALNTQVGILRSPVIAEMVTRSLRLEDTDEYRQAIQPSALTRLMIRAGLKKRPEPLTGTQRFRLTAAILMGRVRISNDGRSTIVDVVARAADAQRAAAIANAYVAAYLSYERQAKIDAARLASELLEEQIAPLRHQAEQAEQAVSRYREEQGLNPIAEGGEERGRETLPMTPADARLAQMNRELGTAEADLARVQAQYRQASAAAASGDAGALSAVTGSQLIQNLALQQATVNARISMLSTTALGQNPELRAAQSQSARIGAQIAADTGRILHGLDYEVRAAQGRVDALKAQTQSLQSNVTTEGRANIKLRQLLSEATAAQSVYRDYLSRLTQISAETTIQQAEVRVIAPGEVPLAPAGPPRKEYGAIALILALGAGVGAALLRDRGRRGIRTLAELEQRTHLFGIGILPSFKGNMLQQFGNEDFVYTQMLNAIRTMLSFGQIALRAQVVVVTSAQGGEGKTTLSISLAASVAARGQRALVIDCDPYNPSVLRMFGASGGEKSFFSNVRPGVDVLAAPRLRRRDALDFAAIGAFIESHRADYDQIIIDTPPVLAFPEAGAVASMADGVILAVKWQSTDAASVVEAARLLRAYDARCLGAVLTGVQLDNLRDDEGGRMGVYARYKALAAAG